MPPVGFETTISAGKRPWTYTLDRAATGTDTILSNLNSVMGRKAELHTIPDRTASHAVTIIMIFIYCNWVVTRWQWLFYMYTKHEIGYY